jgi:hypothetical protein
MTLRRLCRDRWRRYRSVSIARHPVGADSRGQGTAEPTAAAPSEASPRCQNLSNYICGWTSTYQRGGFHWWSGSVSDTVPLRSMWDRKANDIVVYSQPGYRGSTMWVRAGQQVGAFPWPVRSIAADPCLAATGPVGVAC